jgi:hypothetical protein
MTTDWSDWNPHPHMALAQYTQRVPLARNSTGMGNNASALAGGGTTNIISGVAIDQPSFQMLIGFEYVNVAATVPFGRLKFLWQDVASGFQVDPDWAILPGGALATEFAYISGPAKADQLTIELDNLDPAQILTFSFGVSAVSHVYERFRVQEVGVSNVPQFTRPALLNQMGVLGSVGANIPVSSHIDRLASAWGGQAVLSVDNSAGAVSVLVQLLDPGIIAGGSPLYGTAGLGTVAAFLVPGGAVGNALVSLPYGPVVIRETNASAVNAVQPTTTLMRLEP